MSSRFLPQLKETKRQNFTAEIKGFVLEFLYTKYGKLSQSGTYVSSRDELPNFNIRIELKNIENDAGLKIEVTDATIPFSAYFKHYGFPKLNDRIKFTARLAIQNNLKKAFKYVNSISYLNQKSQLRMNLKYHDYHNFVLLGYLYSTFPIKVIKNQEGRIGKFNSSWNNAFSKKCVYEFQKYTHRYSEQMFQALLLNILQREGFKRYQKIGNEKDIIYVKNNKIIGENEIKKIEFKILKEMYFDLSMKDFCMEYADEKQTVDLSIPILYKLIKTKFGF